MEELNHDKNDLSFLDHFEILRKKIIIIILVLLISTIVSFFYIDKIISFLQYPVKNLKIELNFFKPQEKFLTYLRISFFSGIFFTVPLALFQIGSFIFPALKKNEKKYFIIVIIAVFFLFIGGCLLSYFILTPFMFNFFINFAKEDNVKALWSISEYFNILIMMILLIGLVFEFPIVLIFLIKIGILSVNILSKFRRHAIILIFIIAAVITPTVDVLTQCIVGGLMYVLFELTIIIGRIIEKKNIEVE